MAVSIYVFDFYQQSKPNPTIQTLAVLNPTYASESDIFKNGKCFKVKTQSADNNRIPAEGVISACLEFELGEDAGTPYNFECPAYYDTITFGKKMSKVSDDARAELTPKQLGKEMHEEYVALKENVEWCLGDPTKNKMLIKMHMKKAAPKELYKNWESCKLAIYIPDVIEVHVNTETYERIQKRFEEKGPIQIAPPRQAKKETDKTAANVNPT